jgi:hypothetical protein
MIQPSDGHAGASASILDHLHRGSCARRAAGHRGTAWYGLRMAYISRIFPGVRDAVRVAASWPSARQGVASRSFANSRTGPFATNGGGDCAAASNAISADEAQAVGLQRRYGCRVVEMPFLQDSHSYHPYVQVTHHDRPYQPVKEIPIRDTTRRHSHSLLVERDAYSRADATGGRAVHPQSSASTTSNAATARGPGYRLPRHRPAWWRPVRMSGLVVEDARVGRLSSVSSRHHHDRLPAERALGHGSDQDNLDDEPDERLAGGDEPDQVHR